MPAKLPHYWPEAVCYLKKEDKVLASLIDTYPLAKLRLKKDSFTTLARAVCGQQISVKAADSIWARVVQVAKGSDRKILPQNILGLSIDALRKCGLSLRKVEYIRALAVAFVEKKISSARLARLDDKRVKEELVSLKGIGPWTADMYLMFNLWRPNILPLGDLGLIRAIEIQYLNGKKSQREEIKRVTQKWEPYSTVAVWYLWRSLDPLPVEY